MRIHSQHVCAAWKGTSSTYPLPVLVEYIYASDKKAFFNRGAFCVKGFVIFCEYCKKLFD